MVWYVTDSIFLPTSLLYCRWVIFAQERPCVCYCVDSTSFLSLFHGLFQCPAPFAMTASYIDVEYPTQLPIAYDNAFVLDILLAWESSQLIYSPRNLTSKMLHANGSGIIITSAGISARPAIRKDLALQMYKQCIRSQRWGDCGILPLFCKSNLGHVM